MSHPPHIFLTLVNSLIVRMMGQSVGPVLGGILTQYLGFRSIFWFLTIFGSLVLLGIVAFLPETLRAIAGNGTVRLTGVQKPLIYMIRGQPDVRAESDTDAPKRRVQLSTIVTPLRFLVEKDVLVTLLYGSVIYTVWSMVTSSTTAIFQERYHLQNLYVGLAFLPNGTSYPISCQYSPPTNTTCLGFGCVLGSYLTGYLMDHDFRRTELSYKRTHNIDPSTKLKHKDLSDFPIEHARLRNIWWIILLFITSTAVYGPSLSYHLAFPLVLQFFIAYTATAVFSINSALVIDLYPGKSASATAVNNLVRCSVGAVGVAVVQVMVEGMGVKAAFGVLAAVVAGLSPMVWVEWRWGMKWRMERAERLRA